MSRIVAVYAAVPYSSRSTMLKTTYRKAPVTESSESLPSGWSEHKAPTGHTYYYNASTKQSTYTRPVAQPVTEDLQIDYNATAPDQVVQASMKALDEFHKNSSGTQRGRGQGHFTGGRSYQDRSRRNRDQDRPKFKAPIPNCEPWILVKTKFGRRFVHNAETKDSFWKFPQDVMMAVIEMDRLEWEAKKKAEEKAEEQKESEPVTDKSIIVEKPNAPQEEEYDSDEYEEVEVTDDEGEGETAPKRMRIDEDGEASAPKPMEFDEDDIAWQLAQMEEDEGEQDYGDEGYDDFEGEDEDGLPLTAEDSVALFRSLLDDNRTDPYSTFDALIEYNNAAIIDDPRWVSLPNMSSRRTAFTNWSRDRIAELRAQEATTAATRKKRNPRAAYLSFLQDNATTKLYWPEFKRKFKKEPEMKDLNFQDRDRERLYREYVAKLKLAESDRKKEFRDLLKGVPKGDLWNRRVGLEDLPDVVVNDLRFYLIRDRKSRDELVMAHVETL